MAVKKKKPSLLNVTNDLYYSTFTAIFMLLFQALINRFKKHRDTANIRFDRIVG